MKKPAYRRKPAADRRSEVYQVRLTKDERLALQNAAKAAGQPVAAYLREKALA